MMIKIIGLDNPCIYNREVNRDKCIEFEERKEGMKISLLYDPMFKTMFMNENRLKYSCKLFSYFLDVSYETLLKNIRLGKNELDKEKEKSRGERADYVAVIDGTFLNIEVNNNDAPHIMERNQEYAHRLFAKKNTKGEKEYIYTQVIQISLNNFAFEGKDQVFNIHCDQDSEGEIYNDKLIFIEIYIPNLRKKRYNKEKLSEVERYLLTLVEMDINASLELGKGDAIMNEYINESIDVTDNESFGESYDKEWALREQESRNAMAKGLKQGQMEIIKRLNAKLDIDSIVELTGLSKEEVENYLQDN